MTGWATPGPFGVWSESGGFSLVSHEAPSDPSCARVSRVAPHRFASQGFDACARHETVQSPRRHRLSLGEADDLAGFALLFASQETRAGYRVDDVVDAASPVTNGVLARASRRSLQGKKLL